MIKSINGLEYGGAFHTFFWDTKNNPNAIIDNGLANCTTFVYGDVLRDLNKPMVSRIANAGNWHNYLINGWLKIPYEKDKLKIGDVIEWSKKNHVARYSNTGYVSGSFYTGIHGKAYYNGGYDTRNFSSLKELSDFMISNYPYRFFHYIGIDTECSNVGGQPDYILVMPLQSVSRNEKVNQIQVLTNEQYVRDENRIILCCAESGYYNVLNTKEDGYTWYEVEENKFIVGVNNRVIYLPKETTKDIKKENVELKILVDDYKKRLDKIKKLSEVNNE